MFLILFFFFFSEANLPPEENPSEVTGLTETAEDGQMYSQLIPRKNCPAAGSVAALNRDMTFNGKIYRAGTEIYFDEEGNAFAFTEDKNETPIELKTTLNDIPCKEFTQIPEDPITGELGEYSLPIDYKLAGKGKAKKRKGVTHCYRAVKAIVRKQIKLTGVSAYMAAPQLRRAGYTKYSYKAAPNGAICVFNPGGKKTASGGHKHGHIGIKGRTGVVNPNSGFALGRPFEGCYAKGKGHKKS